MGWGCTGLDDEWMICHRGGFNGVFVTNKDRTIEIKIPKGLLLEWAAEQIILNRIIKLEDLEAADVLCEVGLIQNQSEFVPFSEEEQKNEN